MKWWYLEYTAYPTDRHLVGSESAGLVGADDRRAAERLDGRQTSHDRVLLGHTSCAESQTRGDDCRQTFWNSGHGQRHGDLEVVDSTLKFTVVTFLTADF